MNGGSSDVLSDVAGAETRRIPNGSKFPPDAPPRSAKLRRWQRHSRHGQLLSPSLDITLVVAGGDTQWKKVTGRRRGSSSGVEVAAVMLKESGSPMLFE